MELLIVALVFWFIFMALGGYVSSQKNREAGEGMILGFLFGPFGVLIAALLPSKVPTTPPPVDQVSEYERAVETAEDIKRYNEKMRAIKEAERAAFEVEYARRQAAKARRIADRDDAYRAKGIEPGRFAIFKMISVCLLDWYRGLGDLGQMFVWAVLLALPAGCFAILLFRSHH